MISIAGQWPGGKRAIMSLEENKETRTGMAVIALTKNLNKENPYDNEVTHVGQGIYAIPVDDSGIWDLQMNYAENICGTDHGTGIPCVVLDSWTNCGGTNYSQVEISVKDYDVIIKCDVFFKFKIIIESKYVELI